VLLRASSDWVAGRDNRTICYYYWKFRCRNEHVLLFPSRCRWQRPRHSFLHGERPFAGSELSELGLTNCSHSEVSIKLFDKVNLRHITSKAQDWRSNHGAASPEIPGWGRCQPHRSALHNQPSLVRASKPEDPRQWIHRLNCIGQFTSSAPSLASSRKGSDDEVDWAAVTQCFAKAVSRNQPSRRKRRRYAVRKLLPCPFAEAGPETTQSNSLS
jgi:hypothetical protein